jgi:hypothetical protein
MIQEDKRSDSRLLGSAGRLSRHLGAPDEGRSRPRYPVTGTLVFYLGKGDSGRIVYYLLFPETHFHLGLMQEGGTPLMVASQAGHLDVVQSLLSAGVSINRTMWDGATPLFLAAQVGPLHSSWYIFSVLKGCCPDCFCWRWDGFFCFFWGGGG